MLSKTVLFWKVINFWNGFDRRFNAIAVENPLVKMAVLTVKIIQVNFVCPLPLKHCLVKRQAQPFCQLQKNIKKMISHFRTINDNKFTSFLIAEINLLTNKFPPCFNQRKIC